MGTKDCTRECISDGCNAGLDGGDFAAIALEQARRIQSMRSVIVDERAMSSVSCQSVTRRR